MMNSEFLKHFNWVKELLNQKLDYYFERETVEYAILHQLQSDWSEENGLQLLKDLDEKYGETAKRTVSKFLKVNIIRDWAAVGERDAHEGTEIDDFFRILWEPLQNTGFEYTRQNKGSIVVLTVTRCPVFELAEKTGMHEWFYHMACTSDFYSTPSFSSKIGFTRTKSLMQGDECCNHTYYYKNTITDDMRLGYCGLFCGNCPNYQQTDAVKPIAFDKEDFFEPCQGCNSVIKTNHCANCDIMKCNQTKNTRMCYECKDFPCAVMKDFIKDPRYPYHQYVENNMKLLIEEGLIEWQTIQREKYICRECNKVLNFFQNKCDHCGTAIEP